MREVIKTAATVEEATALALAELALEEEDVSVEVLELPQKKLFKTTPAKVRVTCDADEKPAPKTQAKAEPAKAAEAPKAAPAAPSAEPKMQAPKARAEEDAEEVAIELASHEKAAAAAAYLKEVCAKMGTENITITAATRGEILVLKIDGEDAGNLIGRRGETMEALSYLASLVANREGGDYLKLNLDINAYRSKRERNLTELAKRKAAQVAKTGRSLALEPMNPYERRIIHATVSTVAGVTSESTGEGSARRVVISSTAPGAQKRPYSDDRRDRGPRRDDRGPRRDDRGPRRDDRGPRKEGPRPNADWQRNATPMREYADKPRTDAAPVVSKRTETINDAAGLDLPLYGKIEL